MGSLLEINRIILSIQSVNKVYQHLRQAGEQGYEGVALWAGVYTDNGGFEIKTTLIPKQKAYNIEGGLLYSVDADELHRINVWLYENKQTLISQIHSHPGEAYHSETDDAYPIVARMGGLSIVVPDFAFRPFELNDWAVYRLLPNKGWVEQTSQQVNSLITIVE